jgi:hypothetical protein
MANEVFWFDSTDVGSPTLNNAAGTIISVLDACLVNGFNSKSVTSIVVASNVATVTCTSHGFVAVPGKYVEIAGAAPSGLNGIKLLTAVTNANTFTFAAPGISDQTATGTITAKRAAIGWGKAFSGTNKAAYRSADVAGTRLYLRIDDTNAGVATATDARAVMYESMSDVDTGTGPSPTVAQLSGGQFWNKGANTATAKTWALVGDSRIFYLFTQQSTGTENYSHAFGDIVSYRAADAYGCILAGLPAAVAGGATQISSFVLNASVGTSPANTGYVISRLAAQTGTCVAAGNHGIGRQDGVFGGVSQPVYPSPVDNGAVFSRPVYVSEGNGAYSHPIRGELPGVAVPMALAPFGVLEVVSGFTGLTGSMLSVGVRSTSAGGRLMFDISNAWRS